MPINSLNIPFPEMILSSSRKHRTSRRTWINCTRCTKTSQARKVFSKSTSRQPKESSQERRRRSSSQRNRSWRPARSNRTISPSLSSSNRSFLRFRVSNCRYLTLLNPEETLLQAKQAEQSLAAVEWVLLESWKREPLRVVEARDQLLQE